MGITLMCNFWDGVNITSLHELFYDHAARALDTMRKKIRSECVKMPIVVTADTGAALRALDKPVDYVGANKPFIYLRSEPSTEAGVVGVKLTGQTVRVSHLLDGWLRTASPVQNGCFGWALEVGTKLG